MKSVSEGEAQKYLLWGRGKKLRADRHLLGLLVFFSLSTSPFFIIIIDDSCGMKLVEIHQYPS